MLTVETVSVMKGIVVTVLSVGTDAVDSVVVRGIVGVVSDSVVTVVGIVADSTNKVIPKGCQLCEIHIANVQKHKYIVNVKYKFNRN